MREAIKERRREQLMEATIECIAAKGFAGLTLADVAREAGLSVGIVNFYFTSKDQLLIDTFSYLVEEYQRVTDANLRAAGDDPAQRIAATINTDFLPSISNRKRITVWYAFWGETRWRPEFLKICQRLSTDYHAQTRQTFAQLIESAGRKDLDADSVTRGFHAIIDGLWLDMLINPRDFDRDAARAVVFTYLNGLFPANFAQSATTTRKSARA
jgi:TetR/AcrR family transcriptional repressor of bet genes